MDTESRLSTPRGATAAHDAGDSADQAPTRKRSASALPSGRTAVRGAGPGLWTENRVGTARMPDPVRTAAVRAALIASVTLIEAVVAMFGTLAGAWVAAPALLATVLSTVVSTWAVVDVWVTRQVWNQRHGVVSSPSSAARALRRERRRERRAARSSRSSRSADRPREDRVRGHVVSRA
ncbi:hypothetical protein ABZ832_29185 [Streptantibioticus parmotrematis]|uniref:hypothetical protein n=1 Tax=Streptantibioticus parmotrematis TaxID=2873249 RepID=UPI00340E361A